MPLVQGLGYRKLKDLCATFGFEFIGFRVWFRIWGFGFRVQGWVIFCSFENLEAHLLQRLLQKDASGQSSDRISSHHQAA